MASSPFPFFLHMLIFSFGNHFSRVLRLFLVGFNGDKRGKIGRLKGEVLFEVWLAKNHIYGLFCCVLKFWKYWGVIFVFWTVGRNYGEVWFG